MVDYYCGGCQKPYSDCECEQGYGVHRDCGGAIVVPHPSTGITVCSMCMAEDPDMYSGEEGDEVPEKFGGPWGPFGFDWMNATFQENTLVQTPTGWQGRIIFIHSAALDPYVVQSVAYGGKMAACFMPRDLTVVKE